MALFDILKSEALIGAIGTLAKQAKNTASKASSNTPGGLGGLLGAGALGALLGKSVSSDMVRNVALVGAGAVAWNFYKKWADSRGQASTVPVESASWQASTPMTMSLDETSLLVMRAMIFAARADGSIDATELKRIEAIVQNMLPGQDVRPQIDAMASEMLDPRAIACQIRSAEQAEDAYRLSCIVIDIDHFMERSYLDALGQTLNIPPARRAQLEAEAADSQHQLAAICG